MLYDYISNNKCFIIAEAGVNHNGDINIAKKLIDEAVIAGVDAIKFQTFKTDNLVTKYAPKALYQEKNTGVGSQYDMLKKLELTFEEYKILKKYCDEKNIMFLSTPFDFESVDLLEEIGVDIYKVGSGDLTNIPLLSYIAKLQKPMIVSTGMGNLGEIEIAIEAIKKEFNNNIILLHCTSNYPTEYRDVNLNSMITMKNAFNLPIGYSDHTVGLEVPIAAVAMGANIIEKHFTLDKSMSGPDQKASLNPNELRQMVISIRNLEYAFGSKQKICRECEKDAKIVARKSIVASTYINEGDIITQDKVTFKRPGNGLSPQYLHCIIGKKASRAINVDEQINFFSIK